MYCADRERVQADLGLALFRGELSLFLGSGISADFHLPSWPILVRTCLAKVARDPAEISDDAGFDQLTQAMGRVRDQLKNNGKYFQLIWDSLYPDGTNRDEWEPSPLLNCIGALLMGSRRGRIKEIWTLNYDDVLEWYLELHGFVSQVVTETPALLRDVDVTTYHPHGFLPFDPKRQRSEEIVFDDRSYAKRGVGKAQEWREAVQLALRSRVFVFIGLSWTDRLLRDLIVDAADFNLSRPTGFWMFGPSATEASMADCRRFNIVPLQFSAFRHYAPFLRNICSRASRYVD